MSILDYYTKEAPSPQMTLDIFKSEWASEVPGYSTGLNLLFDDPRINWFEKECGGFGGKSVLELGPLEAGHSYMLQQKGASHVEAVEGNSRSFLKCLVIKELFGLDRVSFQFGEIIAYLENNDKKYDLAMALGVLYHMTQPLKMIGHLCRVADRICLWTHYYDADCIKKSKLEHKFGDPVIDSFEGFKCSVVTYKYESALDDKGFCGGFNRFSLWMNREDIITAFLRYGMTRYSINFDEKEHVNGPAFCVYFQK